MKDDYLFQHKNNEITVTRHWFRMGSQSHAIHYLRRLTLDTSAPPRRAAMLVFFVALLLTIIQFIQIGRETLPPVIGWILLIACIVLMIVSSYIAFVQTDKHRLTIDFNDGESLSLALPGASAIKQLHDALRHAMDSQPEDRLLSSGGAQGGDDIGTPESARRVARQNAQRAIILSSQKGNRRDS